MPVNGAAPALVAKELALLIVGATALAFLARRTGQPPLVAYLLTGILLGPIVLNIVTETSFVTLVSELGLGFLLFLIGVEMSFGDLSSIAGKVVRIGVFQRTLQTVLAFGIVLVLGFDLFEAVILGLAINMGSTAEVVKLLADKDELASLPGKIDVGVLLIQDVLLVILLTMLGAGSLTDPALAAIRFVEVLFLVGVIGLFAFASSRWILPELFDRIADDRHAFFIHGIAWAFLFIFVALRLEISLEVGAFLAGLSLGQLPYSSEMAERIRPITSLFMVIFFSSLGLRLATESLLRYWQEAIIASAALMLGNVLIMLFLSDREGFTPETSFKASVNMTQVSEFSLVIGAIGVDQGYLGPPVLGFLSLMALLTMGVSAYFIRENDKLYRWARPFLDRLDGPGKNDVAVDVLEDHAVVIGYTPLAREVLPVLEEVYDDIVIVDRNAVNLGELAGTPHTYIYGDIKHGDIRGNARIKQANCILSFIPDHAVNLRILEDRRADAHVLLEARDVDEALELYEMGATYVINSRIMAASRLLTYIQDYLSDPDLFAEETADEMAMLWWRGDHDE